LGSTERNIFIVPKLYKYNKDRLCQDTAVTEDTEAAVVAAVGIVEALAAEAVDMVVEVADTVVVVDMAAEEAA